MAPAWEKLAGDWAGHEVGLIAEVDCTEEKAICDDFEVDGYPVLFFGDPSAPQRYEGNRDYDSMAEFAKDNIGQPICSVYNPKACSEAEQLAITEFEAKPLDDLIVVLVEVEENAQAEEEKFDAEVEKIQEEYEKLVEAFNSRVDDLRLKSHYQLLRAIVSKKEDETEGEVEL